MVLKEDKPWKRGSNAIKQVTYNSGKCFLKYVRQIGDIEPGSISDIKSGNQTLDDRCLQS